MAGLNLFGSLARNHQRFREKLDGNILENIKDSDISGFFVPANYDGELNITIGNGRENVIRRAGKGEHQNRIALRNRKGNRF